MSYPSHDRLNGYFGLHPRRITKAVSASLACYNPPSPQHLKCSDVGEGGQTVPPSLHVIFTCAARGFSLICAASETLVNPSSQCLLG